MITIVCITGFILALAWLTHDRDGLDYRARDRRRAQADRDAGPNAARGLLV